MKTKVMVIGMNYHRNMQDGDIGYIDGYVQGASGLPYAVVVSGVLIDLVSINDLKVILEESK